MQVVRLVLLARAEARLRDGDLKAMPELLERVIACGPMQLSRNIAATSRGLRAASISLSSASPMGRSLSAPARLLNRGQITDDR